MKNSFRDTRRCGVSWQLKGKDSLAPDAVAWRFRVFSQHLLHQFVFLDFTPTGILSAGAFLPCSFPEGRFVLNIIFGDAHLLECVLFYKAIFIAEDVLNSFFGHTCLSSL